MKLGFHNAFNECSCQTMSTIISARVASLGLIVVQLNFVLAATVYYLLQPQPYLFWGHSCQCGVSKDTTRNKF